MRGAIADTARARVPGAVRLLAFLVVALVAAGAARAQSLGELRVGHWVEVKGELQRGVFRGDALEVLPPGEQESLIGTVERVRASEGVFVLLGREVFASEKTEWEGVALDSLLGTRVKVEGYFRDLGKFSAREVQTRGEGRDRIVGRLDTLLRSGGELRLSIMGFDVRLPLDAELENESALDGFGLVESRVVDTAQRVRDDDDFVPGTFAITETLRIGALFEYKLEHKDEYDLDEDRPRDRNDHRTSITSQLSWTPRDDFAALVRARAQYAYEDRKGEGNQRDLATEIPEAFLVWRDVLDSSLQVMVGRQDFDESREWIYDENLDAVRVTWIAPWLRAELSVSRQFDADDERDDDSTNYILYVSNNDRDRHLAGWIVDRRDDEGVEDFPIHFGVRALGEWLPRNESWAELSVLRGYTQGDVDLKGWGFDVGTTWRPEALDPWYFSAGWAWGSGDDDATDGVDRSFRQTGFQDNNARFGGVTSFRYYGELVDPELSNLSIATLGIGRRIGQRNSIDLVWHSYRQVELSDTLLDTDLRPDPDGEHEDLGWELDVVLGARLRAGFDFEIVGAYFEPGDAFPDADSAWFGSFQVRYRF